MTTKITVHKFADDRFAIFKYETETNNLIWAVYVDRSELIEMNNNIGKVLTNRDGEGSLNRSAQPSTPDQG